MVMHFQQFEDFQGSMSPESPKSLVSMGICLAYMYHSNINYLVLVVELCNPPPSPKKNAGSGPSAFCWRERRDWHLLKAVHKALYSITWPQSLRLEKVKHARALRSSSHINLVTPLTPNTFQDCAATVFNSLPTEVKSCVDPKSFSKQTFEILRNRSLNK